MARTVTSTGNDPASSHRPASAPVGYRFLGIVWTVRTVVKSTERIGHLKMWGSCSGGAAIFSTPLGHRPQPSHDGTKRLREFNYAASAWNLFKSSVSSPYCANGFGWQGSHGKDTRRCH